MAFCSSSQGPVLLNLGWCDRGGGWARSGTQEWLGANSKMSSGNAKTGYPGPTFKAMATTPDSQFKGISLSDYKGKYVVFFLHSFDFSFVCPMEITQLPSGWYFCGLSFLLSGMNQHTQETRRAGTHEHSPGIRPPYVPSLRNMESLRLMNVSRSRASLLLMIQVCFGR